ncbi:MAG: guanylate kinase [Ignavibacteriaceae bacterium]|jgi:guanylate kinase|nr:MAG: guanylate kinase [Chlorobiota bacterium]KXK03175.1 MAG: guanylate kinase [Chlorobi bacterium OLB4]MBV6399634.1 Guanylate kinase [Ignavibacteria bacterium]MCC6885626.1 guanylate kinase [Ignavibacteriales bacterium]MCE7953790.1 guanylate kinase [Chlorobi bacterium CHB7]MDL1887724.1 guanylate kinase [Ignavibacteria bacterium CHB1]MEB2330347.1 guanylate kinase [Ignavibacteriaceae bacterium]OQY76837.1 MAG: guanylate kinase [Ignavibacteriales bacterium UTCHB1]RIK48273.1 MAG: guanylate kin
MLLVISAPSGAGKTSIVRKLVENNPDLKFSVSATTRAKRPGEVHGKDYYFLSMQDFEDKIKRNELIEYEKIYDQNYYGTLKTIIDDSHLKNENIIFDVDVNGGLNIKKIYGSNAITVFIQPPDIQTLIERLKSRNTESEIELNKRVARAEMELTKANLFDYIVVNEDLNEAVKKVQEIYNKYKT